MNLNSLHALFAKYLKAFRYGDRPRPLRDWWIIVGISSVLLLGSAGWSYWLFQMTSMEQPVRGVVPQAPAVKANSLDVVTQVFAARAIERAHYLSDYHFVDPSK